MSDEMIDIDIKTLEAKNVVFIDNAEYLPRPLRLTTSKTLSLIVALRTLHDITTAAELPTIESALAKLESAAKNNATPTIEIHIKQADPTIHETTQKTLTTNHRMHLSYLIPSHNERTKRNVDPLHLMTAKNHPYLKT